MPTLIFSPLYVRMYIAEQASTVLAVETILELYTSTVGAVIWFNWCTDHDIVI